MASAVASSSWAWRHRRHSETGGRRPCRGTPHCWPSRMPAMLIWLAPFCELEDRRGSWSSPATRCAACADRPRRAWSPSPRARCSGPSPPGRPWVEAVRRRLILPSRSDFTQSTRLPALLRVSSLNAVKGAGQVLKRRWPDRGSRLRADGCERSVAQQAVERVHAAAGPRRCGRTAAGAGAAAAAGVAGLAAAAAGAAAGAAAAAACRRRRSGLGSRRRRRGGRLAAAAAAGLAAAGAAAALDCPSM